MIALKMACNNKSSPEHKMISTSGFHVNIQIYQDISKIEFPLLLFASKDEYREIKGAGEMCVSL